jgi:molybdenum cofactor cytidylyltransferase
MISAIFLAAGLSSRMEGENKLLMTLNGKTILQLTLESILASEVMEVIVVVGHQQENVRETIERNKYPVKIVENEDYKSGMTSSIQAGIRHASEFCEGYIICMGDMPLLETRHYNSVILGFRKSFIFQKDCIIIPFFDGRRGNPVIFSSAYKSEILAHKKPEGLKEVIEKYPEKVSKIPMETKIRILDIDKKEDYLAMI